MRLLRSGIQKLARIVGSEDFLAWVYEKEDGLNDLYRRFARNMWWAGLAEKLISRSAPIVAIVAAGPGHAGLAVAYGAGLTVCLFTLADRLDTVSGELGWVWGVPTLGRDS